MTNDLLLNGMDAWDEYRANLEDGSVLELMIPLPKKDYVESNVRNAHGRVIRGVEWDDIKEFNLGFHIAYGNSIEECYTKFKKFCEEVLSSGSFILRTKYIDADFKLVYRDCTPISSCNGIFKFSVRVIRDYFYQPE